MASLVPTAPDLVPVVELLARSLRRVEDRLARQLHSDLPPVQSLCRHVEQYRGKMVRPALVILSGLACQARVGHTDLSDDAVSTSHIGVAAVCELVHLATLVHDDVLDEADTRRRAATVNSLHGNETAVVLGDYLFSSAYHLCSQFDSQSTALLIAAVGMTLCEGELLQLHHRDDLSLDEATYFEIVRRKTASLIAVACRLGASLAGADEETATRLASFGERLGIAFQIQDDLLDLTGDQAVVGKSLGKDLEKGKLTLPIIHHLAGASPGLRARSLRLLRDGAADPATPVAPLVAALHETGSIAHARACAQRFVDDAKDLLGTLVDSPVRRYLRTMADAVVARSF